MLYDVIVPTATTLPPSNNLTTSLTEGTTLGLVNLSLVVAVPAIPTDPEVPTIACDAK